MENGHPDTLRNLGGTDQYDIARGDAVVADKISSLAIISLRVVLRFLENCPDVSLLESLENVWGRIKITSMNLRTCLPTSSANVSSEIVSLARVRVGNCKGNCSFQSRFR